MALINELRAKQERFAFIGQQPLNFVSKAPHYLQEIDGLKSLLAESSEDKEMVKMATEELGEALEEETRLQKLVLKSLLPKDDADERDCILEVRAGTGGEEASLFAMDIFKM
ncbi:hypothetical protein K1719_000990 [Acacia pycnantha]|nr:hypothetical protein K1719_000990 [Acacia pycnantha]